jgi:CRISPR-associated endonuclease Csn1
MEDKMNWRLALDLGTNSIGWAVLQLQKDNDKTTVSDVIDMGVRIFSDSRRAKDGKPLNEERRLNRQMRRQKERRIRRKRAMLNYCIAHGLLPEKTEERKDIAQWDPYKIRKEALERPLKPYELGRILMQLAGRRGFKSSRKETLDNNNNTEISGMKAGIEHLEKELGTKTLGQWLYEQEEHNKPVRFKPKIEGTKIVYDFYPSREMYEKEFSAIQKSQMANFPNLNWERIHWLIFFQRPLKRPERGKCQFYTDEDRGYKALPSAHRFRIAQEVQNLFYYDTHNRPCEISIELKKQLITMLNEQKSVSFDKIRTLLGIEGRITFNLESERRQKLLGNETTVDFRKPNCFGHIWDTLSYKEQDEIVETLILEEDTNILHDFLSKYNLSETAINTILGHQFPTGTTMLSARFMRECAEVMIKENIPYHMAVQKLGLHHSKEEQPPLHNRLPYYAKILTNFVQNAHGEIPHSRTFSNKFAEEEYKYGKIANPTVHVALNQIRKLINALIDRFGHPTEIIMEIGRELKLPQSVKREIEKEQTINQRNNERAKKELEKLSLLVPSKEDIKKYLLWEELAPEGISRCCPYCGKTISATQLLSNEIEIEHILPYSKTLLNTRDNLTVAHRHCNNIKGQKTPYEAFSSSPEGYNWEAIVARIQHLPYKKRIKFSPNALQAFIDENQFLQKQLTDNAYISRATKQYLAAICNKNNIWVSPGQLTAMLRGEWGLNTLLNSTHDTWFKNRNDHRHHALDALTIGLCDRSMINAIAHLNGQGKYARIIIPKFPLNRNKILELLSNMVISIKPDHGKEGKLFNETALGTIKKIRKIMPDELQEDQIQSIIPPAIQNKVKTLINNRSFRSVKKEIQAKFTHFYLAEEKWVSTSAITAISESDITENRIVDPTIHKKILNAYIAYKEKHNIDGKLTNAQLVELLKGFAQQTNIRAVRYYPKDQKPVRIPSASYKAYMPADYYRVDIWEIPQKNRGPKYEGQFISRAEACLNTSSVKPHPAAKFVMSLYKGDVIILLGKEDNKSFKEYARIAGYATTQNKLDIQPLFAAGTIHDWLTNTNKNLVSLFWPDNNNIQNFNSINVIFSKYNVKKVTITVDGRCFIR